ncbi:MAG: 16S rRNA (cytidine(1402)-2'-O)-methyltransferase [Alphaproteobacteria bacterium]
MPAGLYLVATPIGNLGDITIRALETLNGVDAIACEDARVTGKLLSHYGISKALASYHDHNADAVRPALLARLARGERIALVSDAGTPLVSDPGFKLVRAAIDAGITVTSIPGASALLTALQLSALPTDRFLFGGFLPAKDKARRDALVELRAVGATLLFYESAPRLADALAAMAAVLGDRPAAVARELTKLFEEVRRGSLAELAAHYASAGPPKGEIVVVVGPPSASVPAPDDEVEARLVALLGQHTLRDAVDRVAAETGAKRRDVYRRAVALAQARGTTGGAP